MWGVILSKLFNFANSQDAVLYPEAEVVATEGHAIDPIRVVLVRGAGILRQKSQNGVPKSVGHLRHKFIREYDLKRRIPHRVGKTAYCVGMAVRVGKLGLNVQ